jgi:hypothetical protein
MSPRLNVSMADRHAGRDQLSPRRLDVGNDGLQPFCEPAGILVIPVPIAMKHDEPAEVSCTNHSTSLTR